MDELVHYGVKGMHWGVRKNSGSKTVSDTGDVAKMAAKPTPRDKVRLAKGAAITAAILAAAGPVAMQSISLRAEKKRGVGAYNRSEAEIRNIGTSGRFGVNGQQFKPNRKGVYNIYSEGGVKNFQNR